MQRLVCPRFRSQPVFNWSHNGAWSHSYVRQKWHGAQVKRKNSRNWLEDSEKLYLMHLANCSAPSVTAALVANRVTNSLKLWQERLGHANHSVVHHMHSSNLVDGIKIEKSYSPSPFCEGCVFGKQHQLPFPASGRSRATAIGGLIHSDLCGLIAISHSDNRGWFMSKYLIQLLAKRGIIHQISTQKTPEQNGVAER
jgi:hypothetical protein